MGKALITQLVSSIPTCLTWSFNFIQLFHILLDISIANLFSTVILPESYRSETSGFAMLDTKIGQEGIVLMSKVIFQHL